LSDSPDKIEIINWLENGVNINKYIKPFICTFWGVQYDTTFPPIDWNVHCHADDEL
jgi:hypothetical protein